MGMKAIVTNLSLLSRRNKQARRAHGLYEHKRTSKKARTANSTFRPHVTVSHHTNENGKPYDCRNDCNGSKRRPVDGPTISRRQPDIHEQRLHICPKSEREQEQDYKTERSSPQKRDEQSNCNRKHNAYDDQEQRNIGRRIDEAARRCGNDLERSKHEQCDRCKKADCKRNGKALLPRHRTETCIAAQ